MKRLLAVLLAGLILVSCDVEPGHSYSGAGSISAWKKGSWIPKIVVGDSTGFGEARTYCLSAGGGVITLGPGLENLVYTTPVPANISVIKNFSTGTFLDPVVSSNGIIARLGPVSSAGSGGAIRIVDGVTFPLTRAGVQAAIDDLPPLPGAGSGSPHAGLVLLPGQDITGTGKINLYPDVTIRGMGNSSRFMLSGPTDTLFLARGPNMDNVRLSDFSFWDSNVDQVDGAVGVFFDNVVDCWMDRVEGGGIFYFQNASVRVEDCVVDNTGYWLLNACRECKFRGCESWSSTGSSGWVIQNSLDNSFLGCISTYGWKHGFEFKGGSDRNTLVGCDVRNPSQAAVNTYSCLYFDATSDSNMVFGGRLKNVIPSSNLTSYEAHAKYGIEITAGSSRNKFIGVHIGQAATATLLDNGTNTEWFGCANDDRMVLAGALGKVLTSSDGNQISFTRPGFNYLTAIDASGGLVFQSGGGNTVMEIPSVHDRVVITGFTTISDSLRTNKGLYIGGQFVNKILRGSATLDFDLSVASCQDLTITVTGAALNDEVMIGVPNGSASTELMYYGWVSAANTVTVRCCRAGLGINQASGTFKATVIQ